MRILIATGIFPPDIGGPARYAEELSMEFKSLGHEVLVSTFSRFNKFPTGIRHLLFGASIVRNVMRSDVILVLDTYSVAVPAVFVSKFMRKPYTIRIGGDFLWEQYLERVKRRVPLPEFYRNGFLSDLTGKERIIFRLTNYALRNSSANIFTTPWLLDIWKHAYALDLSKVKVIENVIEKSAASPEPARKTFLWAGRNIFLKNTDFLKEAFNRVNESGWDISLECGQFSRDELERKLSAAYAVIVPSISEVSPNFILSAIRSGKPFIVTKYNGLAQDIQELGKLVDPLNKDEIASAIADLSERTHYEDYQRKIVAFTRSRPWNVVARDYLTVLASIQSDENK